MNWKTIRWGWAVLGFLMAEVVSVAAAFAWVALYSYLVHPGETQEFYQRYAEGASPYVSLVLGLPVFYLVGRWVGSRAPSTAVATAMAMFLVWALVEGSLLIAASNPAITFGFSVVNFLLKFAGCYWGGRSAGRAALPKPA